MYPSDESTRCLCAHAHTRPVAASRHSAWHARHSIACVSKAWLAEHTIPLAHISSLREEAHSLAAQSRAFEAIAQERAEKVLGQIRAAVSDEMVLPVDMSKGVAGALLTRAKELKGRAVQLSTEADGLERKYQDRV